MEHQTPNQINDPTWTSVPEGDIPASSVPIWSPIDFPLGTALIAGLLLFILSLSLDVSLLKLHWCGPKATAVISDTILAIVGFALLYRMLLYGQQRKTQVIERLATIDEMNHHVRNALQIISFNARAAACNEHELTEIKEAVQRINWALREVLPKMEPEFKPFEGSVRDQRTTNGHNKSASQPES
jgi:hypothetical protein